MAEAKVLTNAAVRKYAPGSKRRRIRDNGAKSLFLIIEPSGHKSWQMRFRRPDGKPAKITLGPFDASGRELKGEPKIGQPLTLAAAHALTAWVHRERALGHDVVANHKARRHRQRAEAEERTATSFVACVREFFAEHRVKKWQTRPRRWRETARVLGLDYPPGSDPAKTEPQVIKSGLADIWGDRPIAEIDHHVIHETVREAGKHGIPGLKRRNRGSSDARKRAMCSAFSVLFVWLKQERKIVSNPCAEVDRPGPPPDRERVLTADEVRWFWAASDVIGEPFGAIFKLLLLLGQRLNEVAGMRRNELSGDGSMWSIPGARTKNHRPHVVPLPTVAQALITLREHELVFTTNGRTPPSGWSRAKRRLDDVMLALARNERGADAVISSWKLHDLRRSAVTGMAELGIRPDVIELTVNHISGSRGGIAGVYNKSELLPERREALERWSRHVMGIVSPRPENVVSLKRNWRK